MFSSVLLYWSVMAIGIFLGAKVIPRERKLPWIGAVQTISLAALIFVLGVGIGADREVIGSLKEIGVSAVLISLGGMGGSIFCVYLVRKWMRLTKTGDYKEAGGESVGEIASQDREREPDGDAAGNVSEMENLTKGGEAR